MRKIIVIVLTLLALFSLALAPSVTPKTTNQATVLVDARCPSAASVCHYRLPDSIQAARSACYLDEATKRSIPADRDAYVAWWNSATDDTRSDWSRAFKECQDRNQLPGGKWDWSSMVYVGASW